MSKDRTLSVDDVVELISNGRAAVIYDDMVLDLTAWIARHPGGDTAVHHMVGRDATDEMNAYHSAELMRTFRQWRVGRIEAPWQNLLPPIQGGQYHRDYGVKELSESSESLPRRSELSGIGTPAVAVAPVVPVGVVPVPANQQQVFPLADGPIVDPKLLMDQYDNALSRADLMAMPSLDYATQRHLHDRYVALEREVQAAGLYQCRYWDYGRELIKIVSLFVWSFLLLKLNHIAASALCMGVAWHQMTFIAHDTSHVALTHNYQIDNLIGMVVADWFGGLSLGWWKRNHNVHHLVTNDPVHDPDIQHLPFFAVSVRLFRNVYLTYYKRTLAFDAVARAMIPLQHYMYYPILCFGRFNLYVLLWTHLLRGDGPRRGRAAWFRYFELAGLSFFFYWYFYLVVWRAIDNGRDRAMFVLVSHVATMLVHVQITLLHFAMLTADLGLSELFVLRQLRTTMDVDCPEWLDFLHGGLQFQAIHHLFPRMPRHNFRRAQPLVVDFCRDVGLKYLIYGFGRGNQIVIGKLGEIAKQCSIMLEAAQTLH